MKKHSSSLGHKVIFFVGAFFIGIIPLTFLLKYLARRLHTDSTKMKRSGYYTVVHTCVLWHYTLVHTYVLKSFSTATVHNIFGKTLTEVCSPHLYTSFGTFCVQIGQYFAAQWFFKHLEEWRNRRHFPLKTATYLSIFKHTLMTHCASNNGPILA